MSIGAGHVWRTIYDLPNRCLSHLYCVHCGRSRLIFTHAQKRWRRRFAKINRFAREHHADQRMFGHGPLGTCAIRKQVKEIAERDPRVALALMLQSKDHQSSLQIMKITFVKEEEKHVELDP